MRAASLKEIKAELETQPQSILLGLCLRLAKFKKENKELLTYLLFEGANEGSYIEGIKAETDIAFLELNVKNMYIARKNLRRILRSLNRHIKYSGQKTTEATVLIHFCNCMKASGLAINKTPSITKIYVAQIKKIKAAISTLHEDLQYDYLKELEVVL